MSGSFELVNGRRCFRPYAPALPRIDDVADMLIPAFAALTAFDARLTAIGEGGMIGRLFARLDAVHSSGAEGSTTTFTDLMEFEAAPQTASDPDDAAVVAACADAFASALTNPQDPIATAKNIHKRLFERSPNPMISSGAGRLKTAPNATSDSDESGSEDQRAVELVRQAASHWMFEHIHPFADGNGRVGRLMVPLCMRWNQGSTSACAFLGEPVHENTDIYIDALKHGRRIGDLTLWTRTFRLFAF